MNIDTITAAWIELEEARSWTPEHERIARIGIDAREAALMTGAPSLDAAWIGVEAIDAEVAASAHLDRP